MARRTTLTLEDDVMARVTREVRRSGKSLKVVVNDAIRRGLDPAATAAQPTFLVRPAAMGVRTGMEIDDIQGLLDRLDGPRQP